MKFILQIEVEAEEHLGNLDFPRAVHAIQRLQDWLGDARTTQLHWLMETNMSDVAFPNERFKKAYIKEVQKDIRMIEAATITVREYSSQSSPSVR